MVDNTSPISANILHKAEARDCENGDVLRRYREKSGSRQRAILLQNNRAGVIRAAEAAGYATRRALLPPWGANRQGGAGVGLMEEDQ